MRISDPTEKEFIKIKECIHKFDLDNRNLLQSQFLMASDEQGLTGFGRIRAYDLCSELCSLGVIEPKRNKGIGTMLVKALVQKTALPLYLVCIIPEFFEPMGFVITTEYPDELQDKLDYCITALSVPEPYVVMKYTGV